MLYGIEMNVVDMPVEIGIAPNGVFPIAPLPDAFSRFTI